MNREPTFRFVNAIEYIIVGYFDEIKKQWIKEHSNEVGGSNMMVYPVVTQKFRHVTTIERGVANPYQKPQRVIMRLLRNVLQWRRLDTENLFSRTAKVLYNVYYGLHN